MTWDKKATIRRPGAPSPSRPAGMHLVYLGITDRARLAGAADVGNPKTGDVFRLLPGSAITVGQSELCEVTIPSESLARLHTLVTFMPGKDAKLVLVDLSADEDSWLAHGGEAVQILEPGSEFALAGTFRFRCQPAG